MLLEALWPGSGLQSWAREFSNALEMPEILSDLEGILARRRKKKA